MKKILYVDDEPVNLFIFKVSFGQLYNVFTAESALEGLRILEEQDEIDIVFTDLRMPEIDGIEFVKMAKPKFHALKYYLLTGYELNEEIQEALDSKLLDKYFGKPFNKSEIISELENV